MTGGHHPRPSISRHWHWGLVLACLSTCAVTLDALAQAQTVPPYRSNAKPVADSRPRWHELAANQHTALRPLELEWSRIEPDQKQKWLGIAAKFPSMPAVEQTRIQERMAEWAKLSPKERALARQHFQAAKRVAPQDRPTQWEAYQALPPEQQRQLAAKARAAAAPETDRAVRNGSADRAEKSAAGKTNIVPNPSFAGLPTPVNSLALQAQPGATTTSIAKRPTPPAHHQTGLPKIAASPGFVDKATLLPKRGPQGAAIRSAAASEPSPRQ